jgi:hypothetical protein
MEVSHMSVDYGARQSQAVGGAESSGVVREDPVGAGWLLFASIMLGMAGAFNIIDGIVALSKSKFFVADATYVFSDLRTWGWIVLALGIVQVLAALTLVNRNQFARWFAIASAGVNAIAQLVWIPAYPFWSLSMFAVDVLVIYALAVYGGRRQLAS